MMLCCDCGGEIEVWVDSGGRLHWKPPKGKQDIICSECEAEQEKRDKEIAAKSDWSDLRIGKEKEMENVIPIEVAKKEEEE